MRIKSSDRRIWETVSIERRALRRLGWLLASRWRYAVYVTLLAAFGVSCVRYGAELNRDSRYWIGRDILGHLRRSNLRVPAQYVRGLAANPEMLEISIKQMNYMKLAYNRARAWEQGKIQEEHKSEYVPATIVHEDQSYRAKVRLKGLFLDHLQQDKWSLRVKLRNDRALLGMSRFSIQAPYTRNYIHEWLFHRALAAKDLIASEYRFVNVHLNGKDLGIFAMEEHFDAVTCTRNRRPEGLWFKPMQTDVVVYAEEDLLLDPTMRAQVQSLRTAYQALLDRKLDAHRLFDPELTATYLATTDLFGAHHGNILGNLVCYFNPATLLAEPIGYDANAGKLLTAARGLSCIAPANKENMLLQRLFADPLVMEKYISQLRKLSDVGIDEFLDAVGPDLKDNLAIIYSNYPGYHFDSQYLRDNLQFIKRSLDGSDVVKNATYRSTDESFSISGHLRSTLPIEVLGVFVDGGLITELENPTTISTGSAFKLKLPLRPDGRRNVNAYEEKNVLLQYRLQGGEQNWEVPLISAPEDDRLFANYIQASEDNLQLLPFLSVNEAEQLVTVRSGKHTLDRTLVIPEGYRFECNQGVTIDLTNKAFIVALGPVRLVGSPEAPVVLTSSDSTGQGLVVIGANERSLLQNVTIEKQRSAKIGGWAPRGAIFFYESAVTLDDCVVRKMSAEDGLNIVRTDFEVANCLFDGCSSDAVDTDFCNGVIRDTAFLNSGNDGVDASGSNIRIERLLIDNAGDKGVSAGENSELTVEAVEVRDANIAFASKDLSQLTLTDSTIVGCKYGLATYQKKAAFGPGKLTATRIQIEDTEHVYAVEPGATLVVDGRTIAPTITDARQLFYAK